MHRLDMAIIERGSRTVGNSGVGGFVRCFDLWAVCLTVRYLLLAVDVQGAGLYLYPSSLHFLRGLFPSRKAGFHEPHLCNWGGSVAWGCIITKPIFPRASQSLRSVALVSLCRTMHVLVDTQSGAVQGLLLRKIHLKCALPVTLCSSSGSTHLPECLRLVTFQSCQFHHRSYYKTFWALTTVRARDHKPHACPSPRYNIARPQTTRRKRF